MQYAIPAVPEPVNYGHPVYSALYTLKSELAAPTKRRDRVEVMICAAILYGFDSHRMIVKGLGSRGLSVDHIIKVLTERNGSDPATHLWQRDQDLQYRLLEGVATYVPNGMVVIDTDPR